MTASWRSWPSWMEWRSASLRDPDRLRAEYAIAVRSEWKGRGVGYLLMTRLIDVARQRGIGELTGEVLLENEPMLQMCRELGFGITAHPNDPSIVLVGKKLAMRQPPVGDRRKRAT